jgi:NAD(P)-dependent dehydrogenase (short-subunit alcohol dehydrogenase family)
VGALSNRIAIVTGAGGGIGSAVARSLASEGASVALLDLAPAPIDALAADIGQAAHPYAVDVTRQDDVTRVVAEVTARWGAPTLVFAGAGICPVGSAVCDPLQWHRVFDVNVLGTQTLINATWDGMVDQRFGRIVLVSSLAAFRGSHVVDIAYSASKGAIESMARYLARRGGPFNVLCNAIAPGIVATQMTAAFPTPSVETIPLRRVAGPDEIASVATFLCSPAAAYVTGTVLPVDGGMRLGP